VVWDHDRDSFSAISAARALDLACSRAGLDARGSRLARLGENAIYILPTERVVVRIARSVDLVDRVQRELTVSQWLAEQRYPAVRVAEGIKQPLEVDGRLATFWQQVPETNDHPTFDDLARLLRELHALPPAPFTLPTFDPFSVVPARLASAIDVDRRDVDLLRGRHEHLREAYEGLEFPTPFGLIHGDAHRANVLMFRGKPLLSDFEVVAYGPREWDLTPTALSVDRFGVPADSYASFARTYGRDVKLWSGFPVLREIRELTMTTWLMQLVGEGAEFAREFKIRVDSLREGNTARRWQTA
jgi:aminoglycoside phosphotransferase (APT) family kinase protein